MLIDRIEFELALDVTTMLAVGSGRAEQRPDGQVQDIQRGREAKPCINASSLKGALKAAWPDAPADLFGAIGAGDEGTAGRLRLSAAQCLKAGDSADNVPVASDVADGTYVKAGNAIDRRRGAVEGNRFFRRHVVVPGAEFSVAGRYLFDVENERLDGALHMLARALAALRDGLRLGKGTRHDGGRLRLNRIRSAISRIYDPTQGFVTTDIAERLKEAIEGAARPVMEQPCRSASLVFRATTPFIIQDHARSPGGSDTENVSALRDRSGNAVLWASSVLGVLRSRAAWIAEIDRLRRSAKNQPARFVPGARSPALPADDPQLEKVLAYEGVSIPTGGRTPKAVRTLRDVGRLSSVERLFGVPGWRGLLGIGCLERTAPGGSVRLSNVAIDRFSGGALDTALFHTDAAFGCEYRIDLTVEDCAHRLVASSRRADADAVLRLFQQDLDLFDELIADIRAKGLMIGHAGARGLGWFTVTQGTHK